MFGRRAEKRLDKNGHLVTRHLKDTAPSKEASPSLKSAPPLPVTDEGYELSQTLGLSMDPIELGDHGISATEALQKARRLPSTTATAISKELASPTGRHDPAMARTFVSAIANNETPATLRAMAALYDTFLLQMLDWGDNGKHEAHELLKSQIEGLSKYPSFAGVDDVSSLNTETVERTKFLFRMYYSADQHNHMRHEKTTEGTNISYLADIELAEILIKGEYDAKNLEDVVENNGFDPEWIKEYLHTASPLRDGAL